VRLILHTTTKRLKESLIIEAILAYLLNIQKIMHPMLMCSLINVFWLQKLFHQHMKTKSALIPRFTAYDVTPINEYTVTVPPAVAPTISPAPVPQRLTRATSPQILTSPHVTSPSASEESG
jgi:hypothetical protein